MSATITAPDAGLRLARAVLLLYPRKWRDEYQGEVLDILSEVAESTRGRAVPITELLALAARGGWMRARTSVVFWAGLLILGLTIGVATLQFGGLVAERDWDDLFLRSAVGFALTLPVAAVVAGIRARQARSSEPHADFRRRLARGLTDVGLIALIVFLAWAVTLIAALVASGAPQVFDANLAVPPVLAVMALGAASVGYLAGSLLHPVLALPLLLGAEFWWFETPTWLGTHTMYWTNITGASLIVYGGSGLESQVVPQSLVVVALASAMVTILSLLVAAVPRARTRWLAGVVTAIALLTASTFFSPAVEHYVGDSLSQARSTSSLVCAGVQPQTCLWPEMEASEGGLARATFASAYQRAVAIGLKPPATISVAASPVSNAHIPMATSIAWYRTASSSALVQIYARALADERLCAKDSAVGQSRAEYATALALGVSKTRALPEIYLASPDERLSGAALDRYLDIGSIAEARSYAVEWNARRC